jgi:hypothetical protein
MWSAYDKEHPARVRMLLIVVGFGLLLVGAFGLYRGSTRSFWPIAQAQILTVETRCEMNAVYSRHRRRTSSVPVVVDCNEVDQFRAEHPRRSWNVVWLYSGNVRVVRDGNAVILQMELRRSSSGLAPKVGDSFEMVQNPDVPSEVAFPERSWTTIFVAAGMGALGAAVLIVVFWF